jgi:hypothetical protein
MYHEVHDETCSHLGSQQGRELIGVRVHAPECRAAGGRDKGTWCCIASREETRLTNAVRRRSMPHSTWNRYTVRDV